MSRGRKRSVAFVATVVLVWLLAGLPAALTGDARAVENQECLDCHGEAGLVKEGEDGREIDLHVDAVLYENSIHGSLSCVDCHADVTEAAHEPELAPVDCGLCHAGAQAEHLGGSHGRAQLAGNPDAPSCADCHGRHDILPVSDPESRVHPTHLVQTCAGCHADPEIVRRLPFRDRAPVTAYLRGVHGRALEEGNPNAPTCATCHSAHQVLPPNDPASSIHRQNLSQTCSGCHADVYDEYSTSVHGVAVARGSSDSPTCNDCHGEHEIESTKRPESMMFPENIARTTCAGCHSSEILGRRYGFDAGRIASYRETYHGLASRKGSLDVANCASCHGIHNIYPSSDERSTVHPANLTATCGNCHPNANERFASIPVHPRISDPGMPKPPQEIVRWVYVVLLVVVVGGMAVHNGLIWWYHVLEKIRRERGKPKVRRFTRFEAVEHQLFLISFFVLVITGFALKFPDASWVHLTERLGMTEALRALTHRVMAIIMIAVSISHSIFLVSTRKGRREVMSLIPRATDFRDFAHNMAYHLRLRKDRPVFPRFDYTEKVEYLALIWGTVIMAVTGIILWFPTIASRHLPAWAFPVSEVIHYYEAWLAFLAIVVWHLFYVIFHPEVYPINLTFMRGETTVEHALHKHGFVEEEDIVPARNPEREGDSSDA